MTYSQRQTAQKLLLKQYFGSFRTNQVLTVIESKIRPLHLMTFHSWLISKTVPSSEMLKMKWEFLKTEDINDHPAAAVGDFITVTQEVKQQNRGNGWSTVGEDTESEEDEYEIELDPSDVYSPSLDPNAKFENEMDDNNLDIVVVNYEHPNDIEAKIQAGQYNLIPIEEQISFIEDYQIISEKDIIMV
ncbi:MAG: hypothetical protein EZS28_006228 [Streblomastix strix]|uniref:Uncharacterized protein n=1 Tax=Streblomastix strix TaxID=222440 RepID=A0A5J4WTE6_9EUKA|nr:MAG: hypothetical protein EZS28_006228 [Streblomastix strix]